MVNEVYSRIEFTSQVSSVASNYANHLLCLRYALGLYTSIDSSDEAPTVVGAITSQQRQDGAACADSYALFRERLSQARHGLVVNPDFPLGASSTLFERWRRIFGHFFRSSLQIARYFRLIHVKTASRSASTIVSNPNGNSGFN